MLGGLAFHAPFIKAQSKSGKREIVGHGAFQYEVTKDWADRHMPRNFGVLNCHEMVQVDDGRIFMIGDHPDRQVLVFAPDGRIVDSWGKMYPGGHGMTKSEEGNETLLYLTDSASFRIGSRWVKQAGRVAKTTLDGQELFCTSHPLTVGAYEPDMPFNPTETCVAPDGGFYVTDGYGSSYVLKYNARGQFQFKFGGSEGEPETGRLKTPHGVLVDDRDPANPCVLVSSRSDKRLQRYTLDGKYIDGFDFKGAAINRPVIHGDYLYITTLNTSCVLILNKDYKVVSAPGAGEPAYDDQGVFMQLKRLTPPLFTHCHDVCVLENEDLLVCQWNSGQVFPYHLKRLA